MSTRLHPSCLRRVHAFFGCLIIPLLVTAQRSPAQVDAEINKEVWKQKFGVLDAQMDQQPPYAGWLAQDADGDGVGNGSEFIAGTNPFKKLPTEARFTAPTVTPGPTSLSLTFPTVVGKLYGAESNESLIDAWAKGSLPSVVGDGTPKMLTVPMSAGKFFHLSVTDQATQGDQVSDWAKFMLGLSPAAPIQSQTSYDHASLAVALAAENVVSLTPVDTSAYQPPDATSPGSDSGVIKVTRTGGILIGALTVPLIKSGTAVEGVDYLSLPPSLTFPAGVNSIDVKVVPLYNSARTGGTTVFLAAAPPEIDAADGNYTIGEPSKAGVTIYPASNPTGTGLSAKYYAGSSSTYTSLLNFGGKSGTYSYTKSGSTITATITYSGVPAISLTATNPVTLRFTSNNLNVSPHNAPQTYNIASANGSTTLVVTFTSTVSATSGTGACEIGNFLTPVPRVDPVVDFVWGNGSPDPQIPVDNFSTVWTGQILPQYTQKYYFVVNADDGVKVWVNNQLIIDRWSYSSSDITGSLDLRSGVYYDIRIEYFEGSGAAQIRLWWYSEDQAKQIIPSSRLFPTISGTIAVGGAPPAAVPAITSPTAAVAILGSGSPFSMNVTSNNGGTVTAGGLPSWLSLVNGVLSGIPTAAGIYQFTLTATNGSGASSTVMTLEVLGTPAQLTREIWTSGVTGTTLASVPWANAASATGTVPNAESSASDGGANTGERLRGYFTAPATGNYYFWIAASNVAELYISNDSEPVNKVLRASVSGATIVPSKSWNAQSGQKSLWLSLVAGRKYYLEALHNTGASGAGNHLAVAWYLDPTGNTANPIANGSPPAAASAGGVIPGYVLSPWDNPPTTAIPGALYVTNLQGAAGLSGITATGGAFLRVNGNSAVLQLNHSGLSSGIISRRIYNAADQLIFDIGAQEKNYPALKTTDGGFSWSLSGADLASLNNGEVKIKIATINHPAGEIIGTFGLTEGSQFPPPVPGYPGWTDDHLTSDADNSRFLTQATFGPSPADMASVKSIGYLQWIDNQFLYSPITRSVPDVLANLSNDPQNPYGRDLFFNSWWKNSITAPDQLRQRAAFALSEIFVVSNTGPLDNNGRALADYYDTLTAAAFGNFRDILKQVTLSPAMGVYLDMRGNAAGSIQNGVHPNENYAREILQLFSAGLYRRWPDGSLILDSKGLAIPTYEQEEVTGFARVFTGWHWGQSMTGTAPGKRLPTNFNPGSNYLDPMVLVANKHELGTKFLLDNVVLPAATVTDQTSTSTDPTSTYTVQSTIPNLPANTPDDQRLETTTITNRYDLNGVKDLEQTFENILNNSAVAPYVCRQLIQRLVTSHPKPEYVARVVRAFNGERNVLGVATGVKGDMKEVFRAILLDYEARSSIAAADPQFGKQREGLLRITAPARVFPAAPFPGSTYSQLGLQTMKITTPANHRLQNDDNVLLNTYTDALGNPADVPTDKSFQAKNITPSYSYVGTTGVATVNTGGYKAGETVNLQFTSGLLATHAASPYKTPQDYTVATATSVLFTINLATVPGIGDTSGNSYTPKSFTVGNNGEMTTGTYTIAGQMLTVTASGFVDGQQMYLRFASGGLLQTTYNGLYTIPVGGATGTNFTVDLGSVPADTTGGTVNIPRLGGGYNVTSSTSITLQTGGVHNLEVGDPVWIDFRLFNQLNPPAVATPATDGVYTVTAINGPNSFKVATPAITTGSQGSSGMYVYPLVTSPSWNRSGNCTVSVSTWGLGGTVNDLSLTPLNSPTVFNFYYPDFQYPGEMAQAGMTVPEFQLTDDSSVMNLTNAVTNSVLNAGNPYGYTSYRTGGGGVTSDYWPYMTQAQTSNALTGIPALVDKFNNLLTGGNLTGAARAKIIAYVANNTNFPLAATPTNTEMRNRVRAIVHLIVTSAEFAIQR